MSKLLYCCTATAFVSLHFEHIQFLLSLTGINLFQDVVIVCEDSEIEFWADSESSSDSSNECDMAKEVSIENNTNLKCIYQNKSSPIVYNDLVSP